MRREADNVGPKAELDHWKKRMAKFNSLLDELKAPKCKAVLGVMLVAKSKILKVYLFHRFFILYFLFFCEGFIAAIGILNCLFRVPYNNSNTSNTNLTKTDMERTGQEDHRLCKRGER